MGRTPHWLIPLATIGGSIAVGATFVHFIHAARAGIHGGYEALWPAAIAVGALTGACVYWAAPSSERSAAVALVVGAVSALAVAGALLAMLVSAFGG